MTDDDHTPDPVDLDSIETIEFTTPEKRTPHHKSATPVDLCGEDVTAHRPKDAALFLAQSAVADSANEADRALSVLQFMDAILEPVDRRRFLERACEKSDPLTAGAVYDLISQLLNRWSPQSKVPVDAPLTVEAVSDSAPGGDPVHVVNSDLDLDLLCHPPKDLMLAITSSAIAAGTNQGQQAWCVMLFLDAALSGGDALQLSQRIKNGRDPLDLDALLQIIETLMRRWYPEGVNEAEGQGNRKTRRSKSAQSRKSNAKSSSAS